MVSRDRLFRAIVFAALITGALVASVRTPDPYDGNLVTLAEPEWPSRIPDFGAIDEVSAKKRAFFDFLLPMVEYQNEYLLLQRRQVMQWHDRLSGGAALTTAQRKALRRLAERYHLTVDEAPELELTRALLRRIDIVPASLALSQAATESGWGTSRFAIDGNNLFGIWCYTPGCGVVPDQRAASASHEVAAFESPAHSVRAYFLNLNTHPAYSEFRQLRRQLRAADRPLTGLSLAEGLSQYSELREQYVEQIKGMIRSNQLEGYDS